MVLYIIFLGKPKSHRAPNGWYIYIYTYPHLVPLVEFPYPHPKIQPRQFPNMSVHKFYSVGILGSEHRFHPSAHQNNMLKNISVWYVSAWDFIFCHELKNKTFKNVKALNSNPGAHECWISSKHVRPWDCIHLGSPHRITSPKLRIGSLYNIYIYLFIYIYFLLFIFIYI